MNEIENIIIAFIGIALFAVALHWALTSLQRINKRNEQNRLATWKTLAECTGLPMKSDDICQIHGELEGFSCRAGVRGNAEDSFETFVELQTQHSWPHTFRIARVGFLSGTRIVTGDNDFDEHFHLQCSDENFARQLLTPQIRANLLQYDRETLGPLFGGTSKRFIREQGIFWSENRIIHDTSRIQNIIQQQVELMKLLHQSQQNLNAHQTSIQS